MPRRQEKPDRLEERLFRARHGEGGLPRRLTLCLQPADESNPRAKYGYKYEFQAARSQKDPVANCIRAGIRELNAHPEHFVLMSNVNIRLAPSTSKPPIWPPNATDDNKVKLYTFFQDEHEFPATVAVRISPRQGPLTMEKVQVREHRRWTPIKEWLVKLADSSILWKRNTSSITYFVNKRSGRTFRLMDLPTELRLMVLERALVAGTEVYPLSMVHQRKWGSDIPMQERQASHLTLGLGYDSKLSNQSRLGYTIPQNGGNSFEVPYTVPAPELALLYVSKQVKDETLKAGWEGLKRCFIDHEIFAAVADSKIGVATRFNILGRIQLSFTMKSWFKFFGLEVDPIFFHDPSNSIGRYLGSLEKTCRLELRFRDPDDGYLGHPWGKSHERTACQTVMIDWIMTFAFEHIKHIVPIDLVGYVKKPQKDMWLNRLARQRTDKDYNFDHALAVNAILATPVHMLPPSCSCRKSCIYRRKDRYWTSPDHYGRYNSAWSRTYISKNTNFDFEDGRDEDGERRTA